MWFAGFHSIESAAESHCSLVIGKTFTFCRKSTFLSSFFIPGRICNYTTIKCIYTHIIIPINMYIHTHSFIRSYVVYMHSTEFSEIYFIIHLVSPQIIQPINYNFGRWISPLYPLYSQHLVMSCPLEGNPSASYQWYLNKSINYDVVLIQPQNNLNIKFLNNNRTLYFEEFNEEHNGRYVCSAKNSFGSRAYSHLPTKEVFSK